MKVKEEFKNNDYLADPILIEAYLTIPLLANSKVMHLSLKAEAKLSVLCRYVHPLVELLKNDRINVRVY
jgi:hypothetical protein